MRERDGRIRRLPLFLLLSIGCAARTPPGGAAPSAAGATAGAQAPAATSTAVAAGESIETAVLVPAQTEAEGVAWENEWVWRRYGRFRNKTVGLATLSGRRYDVVTVELADHSERTVYFDITEFFGKK